MSPEDILLETIVMASKHGDSMLLRLQQCDKLRRSMEMHGMHYAFDSGSGHAREEKD
jgi:hypothetical protein